jgi:hypothetical protein
MACADTQELPGRLWKGKEADLEALAALLMHCTAAWYCYAVRIHCTDTVYYGYIMACADTQGLPGRPWNGKDAVLGALVAPSKATPAEAGTTPIQKAGCGDGTEESGVQHTGAKPKCMAYRSSI